MLMLIPSAPKLMEMLNLAFFFELSNFKQSYFEPSKLTCIPDGKVAMLLAVRNCSEVGRSCPRGARRPLGTPWESK